MRFWYSFVLPNYSDANFLSDKAEIKALQPAFRVYLGQAWERLVRDEIQRRPLPGLDMRFRNAARWWGSGLDRKAMTKETKTTITTLTWRLNGIKTSS